MNKALFLDRDGVINRDEGYTHIWTPEIIMDGSHDIEKCYEVTKNVLKIVFEQLKFQGVYLGGILLKPN